MEYLYLLPAFLGTLFVALLGFAVCIVWIDIYYQVKPLLPVTHRQHCKRALADMASDLRRNGL